MKQDTVKMRIRIKTSLEKKCCEYSTQKYVWSKCKSKMKEHKVIQ